MNPRFPLLAAGLLGAAGVVFGAFGAHGLRAFLTERGMLEAWETAVRYELIHAVALLGTAAWLGTERGRRAALRGSWAVRFWIAGVFLFSGSLYGLALGGPRWLGPVTPIGGLLLVAGWIAVVLAALAEEK